MNLNLDIYDKIAQEYYQKYLEHIQEYTSQTVLDEKESNALILETLFFYYINNPMNYTKSELTEEDHIVAHLSKEGMKMIKEKVKDRPIKFKATLYELLKMKVDKPIKSH